MEMHLRKLRMLQTCKKYGNVLKAPEMLSKRNTLIWDLKDNLIYCRIAKVSLPTAVSRGLSVNLFIAWRTLLRLRLQAINPSRPKKGGCQDFAKKARGSNL